MEKLDRVIEAVQNATAELERLAKLKSIEPSGSQTAAALHAQKTVKSFVNAARDVLRAGGRQSVKMKFDTYQMLSKHMTPAFKHSATGGVAPVREIFSYSQPALTPKMAGRRFYEVLPGARRNDLSTIHVYRPSNPTGAAAIVAEGAPKPLRQWQLDFSATSPRKLAVSDIVTEEWIKLLPNDELLEFLILAHTEHVLDVFNNIIINTLASFGTTFVGAQFADMLNPNGAIGIQSGVRWHDFLAAIAMFYKYTFEDNVANIEYPNTWIVPFEPFSFVLYGILQDREPDARYLYKNHNIEQWYRDFTTENIFPHRDGSRLIIALDRNTVRLDIHDDIIVNFERIVDADNERNLYRITVELFYWFYPLHVPAKVVIADWNEIRNLS